MFVTVSNKGLINRVARFLMRTGSIRDEHRYPGQQPTLEMVFHRGRTVQYHGFGHLVIVQKASGLSSVNVVSLYWVVIAEENIAKYVELHGARGEALKTNAPIP
jgi:hypothetical protein